MGVSDSTHFSSQLVVRVVVSHSHDVLCVSFTWWQEPARGKTQVSRYYQHVLMYMYRCDKLVWPVWSVVHLVPNLPSWGPRPSYQRMVPVSDFIPILSFLYFHSYTSIPRSHNVCPVTDCNCHCLLLDGSTWLIFIVN